MTVATLAGHVGDDVVYQQYQGQEHQQIDQGDGQPAPDVFMPIPQKAVSTQQTLHSIHGTV